jgi:signal transduction histidine kinase
MSWNYAYDPHIWPSILTVLLLIALSAYSWRRRSVPGALPFMIGALFAVLWAADLLMESAALDDATKIFWAKCLGVTQPFAVTAVTCFILEYTWPGRWLTRRNLVLLSIVPLLGVALALTNDLTHLVWRGFVIDGSAIPLRTPVNWLFVAYGYGLTIIDIIVFAWLYKRSPQHRWPVVVMLTGLVGMRVVWTLVATRVISPDQFFQAPTIAIEYVMYAIALFGFRIFDPISLARQTMIEQLHDGMLVLDPRGRVASLNPAAQAILRVTEKRSLGQPIQDLLPGCTEWTGDLQAAEAGQAEIRLGVGPETRYYTLEKSALKNWRGLEVGHLLLLHDVTRLKQAQAQIIEQQRALAMLQEREQLARELHDSLGQSFAFVSTQGQAIRRLLGRGDVSTADEYVGRLVEVAREADVDIRESIRGLHGMHLEQGLFLALAQYLTQYEKNNLIHIELIRPVSLQDGCFDPLVEVQLVRILQEALTNIRKHASARHVEIKFEAGDGCVTVTVKDDGQGFDPASIMEESGEHIGLRVMNERASSVGGNVSLHSVVGQGTRVLVQVPVQPGVTHGL